MRFFKRFHIVIPLVLIIVGISNILFGAIKQHQYNRLLVSTVSPYQTVDEESFGSVPILDRSVQIDGKIRRQKRIKDQIQFYSTITKGGSLVLALGCLLLAVTTYKRNSAGTGLLHKSP